MADIDETLQIVRGPFNIIFISVSRHKYWRVSPSFLVYFMFNAGSLEKLL